MKKPILIDLNVVCFQRRRYKHADLAFGPVVANFGAKHAPDIAADHQSAAAGIAKRASQPTKATSAGQGGAERAFFGGVLQQATPELFCN